MYYLLATTFLIGCSVITVNIVAYTFEVCQEQVAGQVAVNNTGKLRCRRCVRAVSLDQCTTSVFCEQNQECFMDELITEDLRVIYEAGCRPKEVCVSSTSVSTIGGRKRDVQKRDVLVACSRCCSKENDCNHRLCGIKSSSVNASTCYSCTQHGGGQSAVSSPEQCTTLTQCQTNEMCFAEHTYAEGQNRFQYGCKDKALCRLLMNRVFLDLKTCDHHEPDISKCGLLINKRSIPLCNVCCGDGGCNFGTCKDIERQLYSLTQRGLLDMGTLKKN